MHAGHRLPVRTTKTQNRPKKPDFCCIMSKAMAMCRCKFTHASLRPNFCKLGLWKCASTRHETAASKKIKKGPIVKLLAIKGYHALRQQTENGIRWDCQGESHVALQQAQNHMPRIQDNRRQSYRAETHRIDAEWVFNRCMALDFLNFWPKLMAMQISPQLAVALSGSSTGSAFLCMCENSEEIADPCFASSHLLSLGKCSFAIQWMAKFVLSEIDAIPEIGHVLKPKRLSPRSYARWILGETSESAGKLAWACWKPSVADVVSFLVCRDSQNAQSHLHR